jgi:hypothetical protein
MLRELDLNHLDELKSNFTEKNNCQTNNIYMKNGLFSIDKENPAHMY